MPNPRVGIWWDTGKTTAAIAHPPTENTTRTGTRLDSNLSHADEWAQVARKLGRTTEDEYSSVPRGRVLLDVDSVTGIILHGPATSRQRLELIARRFGLVKWRAELDQHYFFTCRLQDRQ